MTSFFVTNASFSCRHEALFGSSENWKICGSSNSQQDPGTAGGGWLEAGLVARAYRQALWPDFFNLEPSA